ncbi:hypothetical protein FOS14_16960 [Skermania sp. ID1734]|uniref:hypothetical protein n=1 Tax=Skermania sp. ID1734 TaxID=2597516 RepID=UPI00117D7F70|nr:hypothetical protein [Skermania sp. ID1734]TSD96053.1 hypothetical protein FOS14_16960 [Skermania sp. ID1734]
MAKYNKAIETGIGTALMVGIVVLGYVQHLPSAVVIGVSVGLAVMTTAKTWWVRNDIAAVPAAGIAEEAVETRKRRRSRLPEPAESQEWSEPASAAGRHQLPGYRAVKEVASSRTVFEMRDETPAEV